MLSWSYKQRTEKGQRTLPGEFLKSFTEEEEVFESGLKDEEEFIKGKSGKEHSKKDDMYRNKEVRNDGRWG